MATVYGAYATDRLVDVPSDKIPANGNHGVVRVAYDSYALTADLAAADIITLGRIPAGARVVGYWLKSADLDASGGTVNLGWAASSDAVEAADPDGFLLTADVTSAITIDHGDQENMVGLGKVFSSAVDVIITTVGDTDATSGTISACIFYVVD